ncbi:hypothetical protein [Undibacterium sp. Ren11W]|uniref:hypothetical protein n=1 Tax=Undibacterium sp. Ren11W TaxID=3413045 RepID=UPI003BF09659
MSSPIITPELIEKIFKLIEAETSFPRNSIWYEIQDDFQCILILISIDEFDEEDLNPAFRLVADILNRTVPGRDDDLSWLVAFMKNDKRIEAYFGGNLSAPKMGLP